MVAEMDSTGTITTSYGFQPNSTWGTDPLYIKQGGQFGYYQNDHLGTPQRIVSSSGQVLWSASYDEFGEATITEQNVTSNLRFPGQYYDGETGLHYNYYRYYDSSTGRYISNDPMGIRGGINQFVYVNANPIKFKDPLGLIKWTGYEKKAGGAILVGSYYSQFYLESECVNGEKARVKVIAVGPALGVGIDVDKGIPGRVAGNPSVEFEDGLETLRPYVFDGWYVRYSASAGAGVTLGPDMIFLGGAKNKVSIFNEFSTSIGAGMEFIIGSSTVWRVEYEQCDSCEPTPPRLPRGPHGPAV